DRINGLEREEFVTALGGLFEGPPWIVAAAWPARPFASVEALYDTLCRIMVEAPIERQVALICAHPDLVGRAARSGTLSSASAAEQAAAGLDRLTPEQVATFARLNAAYRRRFGFPFVICARENKAQRILLGFEERLGHSREEEIAAALAEVAKIC